VVGLRVAYAAKKRWKYSLCEDKTWAWAKRGSDSSPKYNSTSQDGQEPPKFRVIRLGLGRTGRTERNRKGCMCDVKNAFADSIGPDRMTSDVIRWY
jgi:hypothetical protein